MSQANEDASQVQPELHRGSCHCGAVQYEVTMDATRGTRCNCSICTKTAQLGAIVKPEALRVVAGEASLGKYVWRSQVSTRFFCQRCGVHVFGTGHLAELGGDFASINLNTLNDIDQNRVQVLYWDGRHDNWQAGPRPTPWPIHAETPSTS